MNDASLIIPLILVAVAYILPITMAQVRSRSGFGWFLISLITTPIFAIIALLVLGDARK